MLLRGKKMDEKFIGIIKDIIIPALTVLIPLIVAILNKKINSPFFKLLYYFYLFFLDSVLFQKVFQDTLC